MSVTIERQKPGPKMGSVGALRIAEAHRGSHDHDKRGGFAADRERARSAGTKGGTTVKERYGADFFKQIGSKGGTNSYRKHGREHYARIGKLGGLASGKPAGG